MHFTKSKSIILIIALACGAGLSYYFFSAKKEQTRSVVAQSGPVYDFDYDRDAEDVLALFTKDWEWLSTRDYSKERLYFMMKTGSPNEYEQRYFGKMKFKVLREEDGGFVGFIAYYMKNAFDGHILFLAVEPAYRGKRYGQQLLDAAFADLKRMGARFITLLTKTTNASGLKLYRRNGFTETTDGTFVYFTKPA